MAHSRSRERQTSWDVGLLGSKMNLAMNSTTRKIAIPIIKAVLRGINTGTRRGSVLLFMVSPHTTVSLSSILRTWQPKVDLSSPAISYNEKVHSMKKELISSNPRERAQVAGDKYS